MKKNKKGKAQRKAFDAADFSRLSEVLRGYLHEDYKEEYVSPASAFEAYMSSARARERAALIDELDAFIDLAAGMPFKQVAAWWTSGLGSAWLPSDKNALLAIQQVLKQSDKERK